MAVTGDLPIEASPEPLASCDAAFSCLLRLGGQSGGNGAGAIGSRNVVNGETLSISRLIELAGDLGIKAKHIRLDWQRLQALGFSSPILALLKNTNIVMLTGCGGDSSEVSVWDPLNPYEAILVVPRGDFERVWTGHVLIITLPASNRVATSPPLDLCWFTSAGIELFAKTSARGQNPKLLAHRRQEPGADPKETRRIPRQSHRATAPVTPGGFALTPGEIANAQPRPPDLADVAQPSPAALPRLAAERKLSPLVRLGIATGAIIAVAGGGILLLGNSATDPVAAAIIFAKEVWTVAPGSARSADRRKVSTPRAGSAPIPTVTAAAPATTPHLIAAPALAAPAPEPNLIAPAPAAPHPVAPSPAKPAAEANVPAPSAAPTAEPDSAALNAAFAPKPDATAPPAAAEPGLSPPTSTPTAKTASPPAAAGQPRSAEDLRALLARGDALLSGGDVASARLFYERAADAGGGLAAIRLGETFDPLFLDRIHLRGVRGDPAAAKLWYRRARDLGASEAEVLQKALGD
jgi:hypothetical protein